MSLREKSATLPNSEIETKKKFKIVTSLSNLITVVGSDCVIDSKNVLERLLAIIKMLTTKSGDMNNNKEADTIVANILSAPTLVELLNKLDDSQLHVPGHHHHSISSSLSSSSWSSSCSETSQISFEITTDSG